MIELIKHAIKIHEDNYNMSNYGILPDYEFQKEFSTIHLNVGRRSGKTSSMMTLAKQGDLIIVHNFFAKERLRKDYRDNLATIKTIHELLRDSCNGRVCKCINQIQHFGYVWIDEPKLIFNSISHNDAYDYYMIYKLIRADLFIKLGE